jgi:hypothetical protein
MFLAGGGIRGGITHGATDELGYHAVENPVHVNDLHATMLHLLGIDHTRLTYRYQGRDFRLTDVTILRLPFPAKVGYIESLFPGHKLWPIPRVTFSRIWLTAG